VLMRC